MSGLFGRSDEQGMLHDMLRRFAREQSDLEKRNRRLHASPSRRLDLWRPLAELGALGAALTPDQGGFGGTIRDVAVVQDALAPALAVEPVLASMVSARLLSHAHPNSVCALLESLISGERIFVLAHQEGFDHFAAPTSRAFLADGAYRLRVRKPCVRHADVATDLLLSAILPDDTPCLFLIPVDAHGVLRTATRLIDGAGAADVVLDDVSLETGARLQLGSNPMAALTDALEWALAGLCAETAALIEILNRETRTYLQTREQFSVKLAQFQALQHRVADMAIAQEEANAMAEMALGALTQPVSASRSCAVLAASLACDAAGRRVGHEAIQMFGGMGVSDELAISHYARRLTAIRGQIGTTDARAARLTALEAQQS